MCRLRNIAMHDYQETVTTGQTDAHTHRQTPNKVIPMCRYASQATQKPSKKKSVQIWGHFTPVFLFYFTLLSLWCKEQVWDNLPQQLFKLTFVRLLSYLRQKTKTKKMWVYCHTLRPEVPQSPDAGLSWAFVVRGFISIIRKVKMQEKIQRD